MNSFTQLLNYMARYKQKRIENAAQRKHLKYVRRLTAEERILPVLRDELYDGKWEPMVHELGERLNGEPYIFKLVNRLEADIESCNKLEAYERKHEINMRDVVDVYNNLTESDQQRLGPTKRKRKSQTGVQ